jgi:ribosomal protein S12 methylthiotransferase RimO
MVRASTQVDSVPVTPGRKQAAEHRAEYVAGQVRPVRRRSWTRRAAAGRPGSVRAGNLLCVSQPPRSVALVTLGCARNEVDSEELAGRLNSGGWTLTEDADDADVVVVNTCGFIDSAKKDSIDTLLAASDTGKKVVAVGCLAERYGDTLAASLPEADAVLGFDSYADIAARLDDVAAGRPIVAHAPRDRRTLLPVSPVHRPAALADVAVPGHAWLPSGAARTRLDDAPVAYLKLASGCDRRCTFCAIPSFRGSFVSRPQADVLAEAAWLASTGARELVLVSENSTSYGKDLGDLRALEAVLPEMAAIDGVDRIRVSYLQPAELRPSLLEAIATTPGVAPYFDLSFQHASPAVLRRMKRFGGTDSFLDLLARARALAPDAGARSNVIVGFPGETEEDVAELERFLSAARLDAIGVFGYSDEEGTDAVDFADKIDPDIIAERVERISSLAHELSSQRAEDRVGTRVDVLVEEVDDEVVGRGAHQGPEVDGVVRLVDGSGLRRGQIIGAFVTDCQGVDLVAKPVGDPW